MHPWRKSSQSSSVLSIAPFLQDARSHFVASSCPDCDENDGQAALRHKLQFGIALESLHCLKHRLSSPRCCSEKELLHRRMSPQAGWRMFGHKTFASWQGEPESLRGRVYQKSAPEFPELGRDDCRELTA